MNDKWIYFKKNWHKALAVMAVEGTFYYFLCYLWMGLFAVMIEVFFGTMVEKFTYQNKMFLLFIFFLFPAVFSVRYLLNRGIEKKDPKFYKWWAE